MSHDVAQMKWCGWGNENVSFNIEDKPDLWPYIKSVVGIEDNPTMTLPIDINKVKLPIQKLSHSFLTKINDVISRSRIKTDDYERILHAFGKSYRDLFRARNGIFKFVPDCIIYPQSEEEISYLIKLALDSDVVVIPFGGGSNIAGCLEAKDETGRMIISLDMKLMNRVLSVDHRSLTARIEAGALGPHMEQQLKLEGVTLGHFPDSFEFSTLGGWIATRSAGMQSDKYGKIEDMVLSLRMVTPNGTIVTRAVPNASNGISVNNFCIGSEGILGVITEATLQVHTIPEMRDFYGYLFPDFASGIEALYQCARADCMPILSRLSDPNKTALSMAYKSKPSTFKRVLSTLVKTHLQRVKGWALNDACLMLVAFEGDAKSFHARKKKVDTIYQKLGAFPLGTDAGRSFERGKYDFPYLRDFVMDRNIMADVSETATVWSNVETLYQESFRAAEDAIVALGKRPFLGTHISHTYHTGASIYFTFGCLQDEGREIDNYLKIKKALEDSFIKHNGTLSHHHAVGFEHLPWMTEEVSEVGVNAIRALKSGLDPKGIMNPGKIIPPKIPFDGWGLNV